MSRARVLVAVRTSESNLARVRDACEVVEWPGGAVTEDTLIAELGDVDAVIGGTNLPFTSRVLDAAKTLRVISIVGVGYDHVDRVRARERGVVVTHTPGVLSDAVAELTMALILSLTRHLPDAMRAARESRPGSLGTDLRGKTLLILGYGRIGREVGRRAHAFGMHVRYHDARDDLPRARGVRRVTSLQRALRDADVVSVHVDLNASTRGLVGVREFAVMKPTAYLVNTSRGGVVDEDALLEALQAGRIAGAALDVLAHEPVRPNEPLLALRNVIVTPHIGSATVETRDAMFKLAIDNLLACVRGDPCSNLVPA